MNESFWSAVGVASAVSVWGAVLLIGLAPRLRRSFAALAARAKSVPFRSALGVLAVGALVAYGGSKPTPPSGNYSIVYEAGETGAGAMEAQECEIGHVYNLSPNGFSSSGKAFAGWLCVENGRVYDDGVLVFNLAEDGGTVTMKAQWK